MGPATITLVSNGELDALALGQADPWLLATDDAADMLAIALRNSICSPNLQDVSLTGGELVVNSILDVHNVETSVVALTVSDDTNTTHVATTSDHGNDTSVEVDELGDLAGSKVNLDGVVDLDGGVRVTDSVRSFSINFFMTSP
jgi:hypothetical protein